VIPRQGFSASTATARIRMVRVWGMLVEPFGRAVRIVPVRYRRIRKRGCD
jgi:hypothetical protein